MQIILPADVVQNIIGNGIEQQAVDGEVTALHVFPWIFAEADFIRMAAVAVADVTAKGCDFDRIGSRRRDAGRVLLNP